MDKDNNKLAELIVSLGSMNDYASTIAQTKKALENSNIDVLSNDDDKVIFEDLVKGMNAIKDIGFSVKGIIAVNSKFDGASKQQPKVPGKLRFLSKSLDPEDENIIEVNNRELYHAKDDITIDDLQKIVDEWERSKKQTDDAWVIFARLSKLQPFQDGNKRTALIAANAALNAFETEDYLTIPLENKDHYAFLSSLMDFYVAKTDEDEQDALNSMIKLSYSKKHIERIHRRMKAFAEDKKRLDNVFKAFNDNERTEYSLSFDDDMITVFDDSIDMLISIQITNGRRYIRINLINDFYSGKYTDDINDLVYKLNDLAILEDIDPVLIEKLKHVRD